MNKKILVTGSTGQLGMEIQAIAQAYPQLDFVFTSSKTLDITDKEAVSNFFNSQNFDYCINCAAYTQVDKAETAKTEAFAINVTGVKNLAESCAQTNTILIHISTDFVFDGTKKTPYTEEDVPNPINYYGKTKYLGEQEVQKHLEKYYIIRTSWLYGHFGANFVKII